MSGTLVAPKTRGLPAPAGGPLQGQADFGSGMKLLKVLCVGPEVSGRWPCSEKPVYGS